MPRRPPPPDAPVPAPTKPNLDACRRCELWEKATQGVPGSGSKQPRVMLVGEQPGDEEDKQGAPFVGPAGQLLRRAIADAGLTSTKSTSPTPSSTSTGSRAVRAASTRRPRSATSTRAAPGSRRKSRRRNRCVIVALGSTALNGVMGGKMKVSDAREDNLEHASGAAVVATYHPSAALRAPDREARAQMYATIVGDLKKAATTAPTEAER